MISQAFCQEIEYHVHMEKPENHYFQVEMVVHDWKKNELEVKLPVWAPGSYLVREFAKNLDLVKAFDEKGNALPIMKTSKNKWSIATNKSKKVSIKYEVYAFELTVRTSFLDFTHGFISGSGVFMYVENLKNKPGKVHIHPHESFKVITTALEPATEQLASDGVHSYKYSNYDQLVDCPIEVGNQVVFKFNSENVEHTVGIYGRGNYEIDQLKEDMAKITSEATKVFGENPNKKYTFIIHNVEDGQGGLEHMNSTVLSVNRWTYKGSDYNKFLSLVAHEYFHLWNVKRIRPIELGPFNYDEENYTDLLWVMEGFTSYYDELLLLRSGYYSQDEYLRKFNGSLNYVEGTYGSKVQPLAHSSYDAWIKAYRPNENSSNTTIHYYTKGQMMAAIFDAMIVFEYKGKKSLDDFMQVIYKKYYKELNRGFTSKEFQKELSEFVHQDLSEFFTNHIEGTIPPDYKVYFARVGIDVEYTGKSTPSMGIRFSDRGGKTIISTVRRNSSAENAGLSPGDEIIAVDGVRVDSKALGELFDTMEEGDKIPMLISRDNILFEITVTVQNYEQPRYNLSPMNTSSEKLLRDYILR